MRVSVLRLLFCLASLVLLLTVAVCAIFVPASLSVPLDFAQTAARLGGVLSLLSVLLSLFILGFSLVAILRGRRAASVNR